MNIENPNCPHENQIRLLLEIEEELRTGDLLLPVNHQVNFCADCWQITSQEKGAERRSIYVQFLKKWADKCIGD